MGCTCIIHTDYVDASYKEDALANVTRIITEALLTKEREDANGEGNVNQ